MKTATVTIRNKVGLHARPAAMLVNAARQQSCAILLRKEDCEIQLNSIIGLLRLAVKQNDVVTLCADGPDEDAAVSALVALIESKFGED